MGSAATKKSSVHPAEPLPPIDDPSCCGGRREAGSSACVRGAESQTTLAAAVESHGATPQEPIPEPLMAAPVLAAVPTDCKDGEVRKWTIATEEGPFWDETLRGTDKLEYLRSFRDPSSRHVCLYNFSASCPEAAKIFFENFSYPRVLYDEATGCVMQQARWKGESHEEGMMEAMKTAMKTAMKKTLDPFYYKTFRHIHEVYRDYRQHHKLPSDVRIVSYHKLADFRDSPGI